MLHGQRKRADTSSDRPGRQMNRNSGKGRAPPVTREELYHVKGRPVLNGLFAVEKGERAVDERGEEFEVCRLIMNLVPTNGLCRNLVGDTSTLPTVTGMSGTVLGDGELLLTS